MFVLHRVSIVNTKAQTFVHSSTEKQCWINEALKILLFFIINIIMSKNVGVDNAGLSSQKPNL